jgi:uracil-DNA glycosylase
VTRCYPGKTPAGRGDRAPTATEQELCARWREEELRLLRPALVVTVGGLAARRLLHLPSLSGAVGQVLELDGSPAIPLPHPSGASGWLNDPANRASLERALDLVREHLLRV